MTREGGGARVVGRRSIHVRKRPDRERRFGAEPWISSPRLLGPAYLRFVGATPGRRPDKAQAIAFGDHRASADAAQQQRALGGGQADGIVAAKLGHTLNGPTRGGGKTGGGVQSAPPVADTRCRPSERDMDGVGEIQRGRVAGRAPSEVASGSGGQEARDRSARFGVWLN